MALIPVSVGHAREAYGTKYQFGLRQTRGDGQGWTHQFAFQAHEVPVPNTVPVGQAQYSLVSINLLVFRCVLGLLLVDIVILSSGGWMPGVTGGNNWVLFMSSLRSSRVPSLSL